MCFDCSHLIDKELRIAVAADTNVAVDNILSYLADDEEFVAQGFSILRLGQPIKVRGWALQMKCRFSCHSVIHGLLEKKA